MLACRLACAVLLALLAGDASAGARRTTFAVEARVVRTARVSVAASERGGEVRLDARVERAERRMAGVAVAPPGATRRAVVRSAPLLAALVSPGAGSTLVVTVLPDGSPTTITVRN